MVDDILNTATGDDVTTTADDTNRTLAQKLGSEIEKRRKERGLSRRELAALIGVNEISFGAYATGTRLPSVDKILTLAKALDCSITDLVGDNPARSWAQKEWKKRLENCLITAQSAGYLAVPREKDGKIIMFPPDKIIQNADGELVNESREVIFASDITFVTAFEEILKIAIARSDLRQIADDYFMKVK